MTDKPQTTNIYVDPIGRNVPFDVNVDDMTNVRIVRREGEHGIVAVASERNADLIVENAVKVTRLTRLIHAILHADERGQGINFYEAMKAAAKETHYNEV